MTVYAYARVSTEDQNVEQQLATLSKHNPDYSVTEKFTGTTLDRPKFNKLISQLKSGDTLVVREVSRLELQSRGVSLVIDNLGQLDLASQTGKLLFLMLSGLAEMERETMLERQRVGIERAKAEGRYKGKKPLDKAVINTATALIAQGMKKKDVAKQLKIGESTLYKYLIKHK